MRRKSPGQYVHDLIEANGYGGGEAKEWNAMGPPARKNWEERWKAAVKTIKSGAPEDVKKIIKDAESKGGGFRWSPEEIEKNGGFAYTNVVSGRSIAARAGSKRRRQIRRRSTATTGGAQGPVGRDLSAHMRARCGRW